MENKSPLIRLMRLFYKLYDYNLLNFTLCMLIGFLVNTYTGAPSNSGYNLAMLLFFAAIALNLFFMYMQGSIKSWVDQTVVINQGKPENLRYNTLEDIQYAALGFKKKQGWGILLLSLLLPLLIAYSLFSFYQGTVIGDTSSEHQAALTRQTTLGKETDDILILVKNEQAEIKALKDSLGRKHLPVSPAGGQAKHGNIKAKQRSS